MGKQNPTSHSFNLPDGTEVTIETGKLATQADGSALVRIGKTMILATAVSAKKRKKDKASFLYLLIIRKNLLRQVESRVTFSEEKQDCLITKYLSADLLIELSDLYSLMDI